MPRLRLALVPIVLCALLAVGAVLPGTTATATLHMTADVRAAIVKARHPELRDVPGVPTAAPARLLAARHPARAAPATAAGTAALQRHMAHELALAGSASGAYVYDMTTGAPLFAERAAVRHPPASVEKLYTAVGALERMGPDAQLETAVYGAGKLAGGVWHGNLYLRGGGDPTFGSESFIRAHYGGVGTSVTALAAALKAVGVRRVDGGVYGDESYSDSRRGEPSSGYAWDPYLEGNLSALAFNRGESGRESGPHAPAAWAARRLRAALRGIGVPVSSGGGTASTPPAAVRLAGVDSPTISQLLGLTLPPSDNFFAETLLKDLGARFGGPPAPPSAAAPTPAVPEGATAAPGNTGTSTPADGGGAAPVTGATAAPGNTGTSTPADGGGAEGVPAGGASLIPVQGTTALGAHVVRETLAELGIHPKLVDGSGLSEEDQTSPYEVVTLLNEIAHTELGTILRGDLAVAGHTGTLAERMRGTAAAGDCRAKTGTLTGVSNLAGYCTAADGDELAFAFFNDGISTTTAHTLQDNMAITLADY
ncbi:MAG TPA: D-alanyl-D-alanine carboxypeptidase [Solirubrobacteraceae bacterium]|jgi:D-alanyl-D-alanine carboxypeptidase/D-alanyl-D-alanine-endopeptidase (penicillin-binding protein 4)|nr:D-alanyl-D-alanine carboxypeptidase [Solirubrobacteraceae bacterium]